MCLVHGLAAHAPVPAEDTFRRIGGREHGLGVRDPLLAQGSGNGGQQRVVHQVHHRRMSAPQYRAYVISWFIRSTSS